MEDFSATGDTGFNRLVRDLSGKLLEKGWKMATAESCTGGWIAKCCTDLPGSSDWFECGYVTYSNDSKADMLGVDRAVLETAGAVSREAALEMAAGACQRSGADISVAVTGIAGPDGGTPDKPVGTVWFGWSLAGRTDSDMATFAGGRDAVRRQTVAHALQGLVDRLVS